MMLVACHCQLENPLLKADCYFDSLYLHFFPSKKANQCIEQQKNLDRLKLEINMAVTVAR